MNSQSVAQASFLMATGTAVVTCRGSGSREWQVGEQNTWMTSCQGTGVSVLK